MNINQPFFTILLCTRNRHELLIQCIESFRTQTFDNYEVIISDNSNADIQSLNAKYINDLGEKKFKYITTPLLLNMVDNYEYALQHATGLYVGCSTDKIFFRPMALEYLYQQLQDNRVEIINYLYSFFKAKNSKIFPFQKYNGPGISNKVEFYAARDILLDRLSFSKRREDSEYKYVLGKCFFGFYRYDLIHAIKEKYGRLFFQACPDYSSTALALYHAKSIMLCRKDLVLTPITSISTGNKIQYVAEEALSFLNQANPAMRILDELPIPGVYSIHNICAHSYGVLCRHGIGEFKVDIKNLIARTLEDLKIIYFSDKDEEELIWNKLIDFANAYGIVINRCASNSINSLSASPPSFKKFMKNNKSLRRKIIVVYRFLINKINDIISHYKNGYRTMSLMLK